MPDTIPLHRRDGYAELFPSEDGMVLESSFYPPLGGGELLTVEYLEKLLEQAEIRSGILWETIQEAVFSCNTEHRTLERVVIARGSEPKEEIPVHLLLKNRLVGKKQNSSDEKSMDYKASHSYIIVRKDELLAKEKPAQAGVPGTTIYGKEIPAGKKSITLYTAGKNVRKADDCFYSEKDGHIAFQGNTFGIEEVLEIKGDVDYSVGHIEYPGDVVIHGEIKDGFRILSSGSVFCMSTVDASDIICKKDFTAKAGVIGREKGILRAGGKVDAKFIENCTVEALGGITVHGGCFHCSLATLGTCDFGDKGRFVGGTIRSGGDVTMGSLGNEAEAATEVFAGLNFVMERRYNYAKEKHQSMMLTLQNMEQVIKARPSDRLMETRENLKKGVLELQNLVNEIFSHVHSNAGSSVKVSGKVHPGVVIHISGATFAVDREMKQVRFLFDPASRKIKEESLVKND